METPKDAMPSQAPETVPIPKAPIIVGGIEVVAQLSAGGMGMVLLGLRRGAHGFQKLVAMKVIRSDLAQLEPMRRMFLDEARLLAHLDHPAIAQIHDFGEDGGRLFIAKIGR